MKTIYFKFGTWGLVDCVFSSHSGSDWNRRYSLNELEYWIKTYTEWGYNVTFKPLTK